MQIGSTAATALKIGTQDVDALYMGATLVWSKTVAPTITASDSLSGRTLTITVDSTTGNPAPTTALTALTLDGSDVLGDATGSGPWQYTVPDSGLAQVVAWTVEASNSEGTATAGDSESVPANLAAPAAPAVTASDALSGRDLTISVDTLTGSPAPGLTLTALTLDAVDVLGAQTGADPWTYTVPDSSSAQTVAWTVEASNSEGTDTASGSGVIPANLFVPSPATTPSISGPVAPGETVTLDAGTYTGVEPITITFALTLDGVDVTGDVVSGGYTIPPGALGQSLVYSETASNGIAPDAVQSVSETVQAQVTWTPTDLFGAGDKGFAFDLMDLSGANTLADQTGTTPGAGDPLGNLPGMSPNAKSAFQYIATRRPTVQADANGRHFLFFDFDDVLVTYEDMSSDTWTVWMVYEADGGDFVILSCADTGDPWLGVGEEGSSNTFIMPPSIVSSQYWYDNTSFSGTRGQSWTAAQEASLAIVEAVTTSEPWPEVAIGDYNNFGSWSTPGRVYAWGTINRTLTAAERADLLVYADHVRGV